MKGKILLAALLASLSLASCEFDHPLYDVYVRTPQNPEAVIGDVLVYGDLDWNKRFAVSMKNISNHDINLTFHSSVSINRRYVVDPNDRSKTVPVYEYYTSNSSYTRRLMPDEYTTFSPSSGDTVSFTIRVNNFEYTVSWLTEW